MGAKTAVESAISPRGQKISKLLDQYGCGPVRFAGTANDLYEGHLLFDRWADHKPARGRDRRPDWQGAGRTPPRHDGRTWTSHYTRIDSPATPDQKKKLKNLKPEAVRGSSLAGEAITAKLTRAPGNNSPIGGLKVVAANGWFAARPSRTENVYKIYAEGFQGTAHLDIIIPEAREMVNRALSL